MKRAQNRSWDMRPFHRGGILTHRPWSTVHRRSLEFLLLSGAQWHSQQTQPGVPSQGQGLQPGAPSQSNSPPPGVPSQGQEPQPGVHSQWTKQNGACREHAGASCLSRWQTTIGHDSKCRAFGCTRFHWRSMSWTHGYQLTQPAF